MIQDIAPHKLDNQYSMGVKPKADDVLMVFDGKKVLCNTENRLHLPMVSEMSLTPKAVSQAENRLHLPMVSEMSLIPQTVSQGNQKEEVLIYLFAIDEKHFFLADKDAVEIPDGFTFQDVWRFRRDVVSNQEEMFAIATAMHLSHWYRTNRYCGCCGHKTEHARAERALVCPDCGNTIYPRIVPAVIVGVTNGDKILVTKYGDRDLPFYALVAGFVEIGETLEECVQREVMEEVGLHVRNIRYYKSQPWGIVDDLLAGFWCEVDGDPTIHLDYQELKEGIWAKRGEVPLQPDNYSLTGEMMRMFNEGKA